jgi:hypothetical protein
VKVQTITVNHGTTDYAELLLRSFIRHHPNRLELPFLLLDNDSPGFERLEKLATDGIEVRQSGYGLEHQLNTHGEILAAAVLDRPNCDAYLFVDSDVCFRADRTVDGMAAELAAEPGLFGIQGRWLRHDGGEWAPDPGRPDVVSIAESVRGAGDDEWPAPLTYDVLRHNDADRIHPFCAMIRNTPLFRRTVETLGLSPALVQSERSGHWWDTFGLMTQVMRINGLGWRRSSCGVVHFGSVSWDSAWAAEKAASRDRLLDEYRAFSTTSGI